MAFSGCVRESSLLRASLCHGLRVEGNDGSIGTGHGVDTLVEVAGCREGVLLALEKQKGSPRQWVQLTSSRLEWSRNGEGEEESNGSNGELHFDWKEDGALKRRKRLSLKEMNVGRSAGDRKD